MNKDQPMFGESMPSNRAEGHLLAQALMDRFVEATGITGGAAPRRYLWTDAFAVCNFLDLFRRLGQSRYLDVAETLVHQVHHVLGRHRADDARRGWISGLSEQEGELHPTRRGLRIGKPRNERGAGEAFNEQSEWNRDGQYFHYLTKWAHALVQMANATGDQRYWRWAAELMTAAQKGFTVTSRADARRRLAWKMSIDLARTLVGPQGHQDPLEGLVVCLEIEASSREPDAGRFLAAAIGEFRQMCQQGYWATKDSLGIGCLLDDAVRLGRLDSSQTALDHRLFRQVLIEAECSLRALEEFPPMMQPASHRLAFRELGLAIGIQGLQRLRHFNFADSRLAETFATLWQYESLADEINSFWSQPEHRQDPSWTEHEDINSVMLATSLSPGGYLAA